MLHGIRIHPDGTATYVNRYTKTNRLAEETKIGRVLFPRIGEWEGVIGLFKVLLWGIKSRYVTSGNGKDGTANTARK
jgi:9-cis-epoxycarotenoid dioxygenase